VPARGAAIIQVRIEQFHMKDEGTHPLFMIVGPATRRASSLVF
jgi:hypothetical protein